ncbi:MAG: restriction endonuclease subunit S [Nitrospirae bacterium]|nr:restriction endonuclease subunit S [Nitrospirota bacterium]
MRLGEVGEIITGNTPSKKQDIFYNKRHINFFKPDDFDQNAITDLTESKDFISEEGSKYARIAPSAAVLVTCIGTIGKVGIIEKEASFNQQINAIVTNSARIISKYLAYAIFKRKLLLERFTNAPVVPIINKSQFSQFEIPLPPLPTQHKIVEILEEADNLRKLRRQADEKMNDLTPSLFVQMFGDPANNPKGWEVKKLKDVTLSVKNGLFKRPSEFGSGVPLINVVDLFAEYKVDMKKLDRVSVTQEELQKYLIEDGDLFFCRSSLKKEGVAKCVVALDLKEPTVFECHTIMARLNKKALNPLYASIYFNHPGVRTYTVNTSQTATMTTVGQKDILRQKIFLPPLPLQQEFAKLVEDIEAEKARQAESRKKLDELFQSLMQRAFTGELAA